MIGGERDTVAPVGPVRPWAEAAHAELVVIPDADHYFREQDALVAEAIVAFLRDHGVG